MFGANKGTPDFAESRIDSKSCLSASCRPASTSRLPTRWHRPAKLNCWRWACGKNTLTMWSCRVHWRPVALQAMAEKSKYDALIALGCIIRGETYHFELVANESGAGVSRVSLDYQVPIANAILTTENLERAIARKTEKGRDAARVAVEMANLMEAI